ncbi:hypothetical protein HPB49_004209 [Dermacentor silvarum]|uniref:Uncharacterized protein n=1 Tax=Dermacentor silvarum TaxID=543639 RepID=A0ACB8CUY0_DERSI|nr:hypothetical protein HPB49_004209 [Dermacentor silvarum]
MEGFLLTVELAVTATRLAELVALGERIGLQGAKLGAWVDEQTAQVHEEVLAEREAAKSQLELETRILGLRLKLAEQELRQIGINMGFTGTDLKSWVQSKLEALEQGKDVPFEFVNEIKEREERILQLRRTYLHAREKAREGEDTDHVPSTGAKWADENAAAQRATTKLLNSKNPAKPGITFAKRIQIVAMCDRGISQEEIVRVTDLAYFSVNSIVNAYRAKSRLENLLRGCRPRATKAEEDERILNAAKRDPIVTSKQIENDLGRNASTAAIRRRRHEGDLHSRVPARKPLLSGLNKAKRLLFAQEHQD